MEKILKVFRAEIKEVNEEKKTLTAIISTKKADRDGDIVDPMAFKARLKVYKEHPVLLSSHNYTDLRKQIGKANKVEVTDSEVTASFEYFAGQGNPEADWAWVLAQKGIASYSIGFLGHQFDWLKEKDAEGNERITGRKFTDIELLEVSQVLVPSNRGALQLGLDTAREQAELCELAIKSMDKGEIKDLASEPKPVTEKENHYSDAILGAEGQPISEPLEKDADIMEGFTLADVKEAINQAVKQKE